MSHSTSNNFKLLGAICKAEHTHYAVVEPSRVGRVRLLSHSTCEASSEAYRTLLETEKPNIVAVEWYLGADYDAQRAEAILRRQAASGEFFGVSYMLGIETIRKSRKLWKYELFRKTVTDHQIEEALKPILPFLVEGFQFSRENQGRREAPAFAARVALERVAENTLMPTEYAALLEGT